MAGNTSTRRLLLVTLIALTVSYAAMGQSLLVSDSAFQAEAPMSGRIWGYAYGDYYVKAHSDTLDRGGSNEYTGIAQGDHAFALRRVYLGYDFNFNKKFAAELLLSAEDWSKERDLTFFIKYANLQWKNLWKGTDLIIGQSVTPAFSRHAEKNWGYRTIERTLIDRRRTPSFDLGIALKGRLGATDRFGYHLMVGNGTGAMADNNRFRKYYAAVFGRFFDQKVTIHLFTDYECYDRGQQPTHDALMMKLFAGYEGASFSIGAEGFIRHARNDMWVVADNDTTTRNLNSVGVSFFTRGELIPDKLSGFARFDLYEPSRHLPDAPQVIGRSEHYDPLVRENFAVAGLDFTPHKNIHIMPNVWLNTYEDKMTTTLFDYDLVYRATFFFVFGK